MGTFEMDNVRGLQSREDCHRAGVNEVAGVVASNGIEGSSNRVKQECIIAKKVYDSCRQQDCLTPAQIGPARAAECKELGGRMIREGEVIVPPDDAATVVIEKLRLEKVIIVDKTPNQFRPGYWDIDLKYVFRYNLVFRGANYSFAGQIKANSIFNKTVTLFGSVGSDLVIATDLYCRDSETIDAEPLLHML